MITSHVNITRRQNHNRIRPSALVKCRKGPSDLVVHKNIVHYVHRLSWAALRQTKVCDVVATIMNEPVRNYRITDCHWSVIYAPKEIVRVVEKQDVFWMIAEGVIGDRSNGVN